MTNANQLTRQERIRAIAMRTREARQLRPVTETLMRTYDRSDNVRSEHVLRGGKWTARTSTLPVALAGRPLTEFVHHSASMSACPSCAPITESHSGFAYDSITSATAPITLSEIVDTSGGNAEVATSSTAPSLEYQFYGAGSSSVTAMTVADVYYMLPVDEMIQEVTFTGQELASAQAQFVSDTVGIGSGSARGIYHGVSYLGAATQCVSTEYFVANFRMRAQDCDVYLYGTAGSFLASAFFGIVGAVAAGVGGPGGLVVAATAYTMAKGTAGTGTASLFAFGVCRLSGGGGGSWLAVKT